MPAIKYLPVSWNGYHKLAQFLAVKILSQKEKPEQIVAIARGGLTLGHLLSDLLQIPISTITIQSYTDIQKQGELKITGKLHAPIKNKRVLIADDVADSGKTLKRAISYLRLFHPASIAAAVLFYKPRSVQKPDFFAAQTTKWILFPYEPTEMILLITKKLKTEGKTSADIRRFLRSLGYMDQNIQFIKQHHSR